MKNVDIHVAIPSYNNVAGLQKLLPQLLKQNFASITVLDDASTDKTKSYVQSLGGVEYIRSVKNLGTVGANNLILQSNHRSGYLLCIDSDMNVVTGDIPTLFTEFITRHPNTGAAVGKIINHNGDRIRWNFNYDINPWRAFFSFISYRSACLFKKVPLVGFFLRKVSQIFTTHLAPNIDQKIDWGIEGFFFVRTDIWHQLQGFDSRFKRFHEGPDLFLQVRRMGYETWFINSIVARDDNQATHSSWYRIYHYWRSTIIYFYKNPSRLLVYRWPRP